MLTRREHGTSRNFSARESLLQLSQLVESGGPFAGGQLALAVFDGGHERVDRGLPRFLETDAGAGGLIASWLLVA
jgi:hypothetical protein